MDTQLNLFTTDTYKNMSFRDLLLGQISIHVPIDISLVNSIKNIKLSEQNINVCKNISRQIIFDPNLWKDCGAYLLNTNMYDVSIYKKHRLLSNNFGSAIGKSNISNPIEIANDIINNKYYSLKHNIKSEHKAREWYCNTRDIKILNCGFAIPKWEHRIGTYLDGDILNTDGMIEIKHPLDMYENLKTHINKLRTGWKPPPFYHDHIWDSHYAQIQGSMKIIGKQWCDYIVYATNSNLSYVERIQFNPDYWNTILWPGLQNFLDNYLDPLIKY